MVRTFDDLVCSIAVSAVDMGMDVSPSDVGFIVSTFLEGLIMSAPGETPLPPPVAKFLQDAADACAAVKDEI